MRNTKVFVVVKNSLLAQDQYKNMKGMQKFVDQIITLQSLINEL